MPTWTTPSIIKLLLALLVAGVLGYLIFSLARRFYRHPRMILRRLAHRRLSDVVIPDGMEGEIHVDQLFLTEHGILVLELRNASGALFAGENMDEWRVIDRSRRYSFRNPLPGLEARVHAVEHLSGGIPVMGRVAIVGDVNFAGGRPPGVATLAEIAEEFKAGTESGKKVAPSPAYVEAWGRIEKSVKTLSG